MRSILLGFCLSARVAQGDIQVLIHHAPQPDPAAPFRFSPQTVPVPSRNDAGAAAKWTLIDGETDPNSGGLDVLHDDRIPTEEDQAGANFFFNPSSEGGRLQIDLGETTDILQVNSYSWHPAERGPQIYTLYASDGADPTFDPAPSRPTDPTACGWRRLASVNTKPDSGDPGGQCSVSVRQVDGGLGRFRYLMLDVERTGLDPRFDQTFFSEIDVLSREDSGVVPIPVDEPVRWVAQADQGRYQITLDLTAAPDLKEWVEASLVPVVVEWYPRIVALLPSESFEAPDRVLIRFRNGMGGTPAAASGNRIDCNAGWFRSNLQGEARGSVVHELVHVVQQYGLARRSIPQATRTPGWIVEGIADYIRWFLFEPETKGAEISARNLNRARHDASYRISANFLHWVTETYDRDLVAKLNAAARTGRYRAALWMELTGKSVEDLDAEWRKSLEAP